MTIIFLIKFIFLIASPITLFDSSFSTNSDWTIVDDRVMGGVSQGELKTSENGKLVFLGVVSTENYGGFSSMRCNFKDVKLEENNHFLLRVKGDGKSYQFRVKSNVYQRHSYVRSFQTNGDWQVIEIPTDDLYATFRGRTLSLPNYEGETLEEVAILIGNKKNESFQLAVDYIKIIKK